MNKMFKISSGIAGAAMILASFAPSAFAATTVTISNNLKNSVNIVGITSTNKLTGKQTNSQTVKNMTTNNAGTGHNKTNDNLGLGGVSLTSGGITQTVMNTVTSGDNTMTMPANCGCATDMDLSITGNGKNTVNSISVSSSNTTNLTQSNTQNVTNTTTDNANTGNNTANDNLGGASLTSGDVTQSTINTVSGGSNTMQ